MPQLGETVTEGTITKWLKAVGDSVAIDEPLFEVSTDKVDSEVPSPIEGVLTEIVANEGDTIEVGQVVAQVEEGSGAGSADADSSTADTPPAGSSTSDADLGNSQATASETQPATQPTFAPAASPVSEPAAAVGQVSNSSDSSSSDSSSSRVTSPIVRKLIRENNLNESDIQGTGVGGKITKEDVESAINSSSSSGSSQSGASTGSADTATFVAPEQPSQPPVAPQVQQNAQPQQPSAPSQNAGQELASTNNSLDAMNGGDIVIPFDNIRRRTAEHMVMSKSTSAHVYTSMEVDFEAVEQVRNKYKAEWKEKEGYSLTYLPFIVRAVSEAVREFPQVNSSIKDDTLVVHRDLHLSIAVDINFQGLIAPVVRHADGKRIRLISREIKSLADRAKSKQLRPDEISGGTLTITNPGPFGTFLTLPIINQPQVAIISTDGIKKKPVVVPGPAGEDFIAVHHVGNIALAWDHRAFDGAYASAFMNRIKQIIETADWMKELQ